LYFGLQFAWYLRGYFLPACASVLVGPWVEAVRLAQALTVSDTVLCGYWTLVSCVNLAMAGLQP
jgi:hypothetical protein